MRLQFYSPLDVPGNSYQLQLLIKDGSPIGLCRHTGAHWEMCIPTITLHYTWQPILTDFEFEWASFPGQKPAIDDLEIR